MRKMEASSRKQAIAMRIAAAGKSNIGIPAKVGKDFLAADQAKSKTALAKLPLRRGTPKGGK